MELEELRQQIAQLDAQAAALFARRMALAERIADCKLALHLPVEDPAQEARVLERGAAALEDPSLREDFLRLLRLTIACSKTRQRQRQEAVR